MTIINTVNYVAKHILLLYLMTVNHFMNQNFQNKINEIIDTKVTKLRKRNSQNCQTPDAEIAEQLFITR